MKKILLLIFISKIFSLPPPVADISIPVGQADEAGGGYWQVPHNGDNEYTCDDSIPFQDQYCDDNKAGITFSSQGSIDLECQGVITPF